jgi:hypothetical protein
VDVDRIVHPTWVRTPLITTLMEKKEFTEFTLEPETVAEAVVKQVLSGYGAQLILPGRYIHFDAFDWWYAVSVSRRHEEQCRGCYKDVDFFQCMFC